MMRALLVCLAVFSLACGSSEPGGGGGGGGLGPPDGGADGGGGGTDGGDTDGGDTADGGGDDGGTGLDAGETLPPECDDGTGSDACVKALLRRRGEVKFTPVARGELGAGPWPTSDLVILGGGDGLSGDLAGVGVDTGQNVYVVGRGALHVRRAGAARFDRYARATNGLRDYPLISVAGGAPGVAYVGYEGRFSDQPDQDPPDWWKSGDVQQIDLNEGGFTATTWDTHNSNTPFSGKYDHSRAIYEIFVPRRGPAAGEVFLGTEHGVVRYQGRYYADHVHIAAVINGSQRFGWTRALTVTEDGTVWYGSSYRFGGRLWAPTLLEWYEGRWIFPSWGYGGPDERNQHEGIGVDSRGHVWAAVRPQGLVYLEISPGGRSSTIHRLGAPDTNFNDLVVDLDDSVWVASDSGLHRLVPSTGSWSRLTGVSGPVRDLYLDDTVSPRALYIVAGDKLAVYRGP